MSAAAEKSQASGTTTSALQQQPTPMDIPVVNINVPDYPDRATGLSSRGPSKFQSAMSQSKQGLTAPTMADMSCSGPKSFFLHSNSTLSNIICTHTFYLII